MHNNFDQIDIVRYYMDNYACWVCGRNGQNAMHHIMGRGAGDSKCESSILNSAPLHNGTCHLQIHGKLRTKENQKLLLKKTLNWLLKQEYKLKPKDYDFQLKYRQYYQ